MLAVDEDGRRRKAREQDPIGFLLRLEDGRADLAQVLEPRRGEIGVP